MLVSPVSNPSKAPELVQVVSPAGKIVYVNSIWKETLGYQSQELSSLSLFEILDGPSQDLFRKLFQRGNAVRAQHPIEIDVFAKDGRKITLEGRVSLISKYGRIACAHGTFMDTTETRREEDAMLHAEPSYRTLIENAIDIVSMFDAKGTILSLNPAFERITGWRRSDWIHKPFVDLLVPEDRQYAREWFERASRGIKVPFYQARVTACDGQPICIESTFKGIYQQRTLTAILGISRDITERSKIEENLRESEERFRLLADACFEGIVLYDQGRILEANQAFAQLHGYERAELIGKPLLDLVAPECREEMRMRIETVTSATYQEIAQKKDGSRFHLELRSRMLPYNGKLVKMVAARPTETLEVSTEPPLSAEQSALSELQFHG